MKPSAVASRQPLPASPEAAANDDTQTDRQRAADDEVLGPLWIITIGMGAFFTVAALVMMFD
jgi:hypothetical protein